jgi:CBS domain containing-hemolysin-like protein
VELEHPAVDTVSGLVLTLLDRPAQVGDRVSFSGIELEVRGVQGRGVRECALRVGAEAIKARMTSSRPPVT